MSAADIALIRSEKTVLEHARDYGGLPNRERADWILRLLEQVEWLQAREAAMREIVVEVAAPDRRHFGMNACLLCGAIDLSGYPIPHYPICPVVMARALLAEQT